MVKNIFGLALVLILGLAFSACEKKPDLAALKREKETQWRERQRQQAIKYYDQLIKNFPDSPHAEEAKKEREALGPAATPAAKK